MEAVFLPAEKKQRNQGVKGEHLSLSLLPVPQHCRRVNFLFSYRLNRAFYNGGGEHTAREIKFNASAPVSGRQQNAIRTFT